MKFVKYLTTGFFVILTSLQLGGCANQIQQIPPQYKKEIRTVEINKNISVPQKMFYMSADYTTMESLIGPLPALAVTHSLDVANEMRLKNEAAQNNIKIDEIVMRQFVDQINKKTGYRVVKQGLGDADLKINITGYGFSALGLFSGQYLEPVLGAEVSLIKNGKQIWVAKGLSPIAKGLPAYTYRQLTDNPNTMAYAFNAVAERVVRDIVSHM